MKSVTKLMMSGTPLLVVGGLLAAGLFIKPKPVGASVGKPIFERGDSFYGMALPSGAAIWAAGSDGKVVRSDDAGASWKLQPTPVLTTLQDIAAWDTQRAVAVGNGGAVIVTGDGGLTWRAADVPRSSIANKLVRVKTLADGTAWAVGEGGMVLRSIGFGAQWSRAAEEEDAAWNDICFADGQGWLVGEFGRMKTSNDNGATWRSVDSPVKASLMAVTFSDKLHGVAVGLAGVILVTQDGGRRWTAPPPATTEHLFDVSWDGARWMAAGDNGVVLTASASAAEWRPAPPVTQGHAWHTAIKQRDGKFYLSGAALTLPARDAKSPVPLTPHN
jgi:photosystem II stability/assembly factor-like uncharacterized protein